MNAFNDVKIPPKNSFKATWSPLKLGEIPSSRFSTLNYFHNWSSKLKIKSSEQNIKVSVLKELGLFLKL